MTSSTKCHHSHFLDIIFICYFIFQCNSCRFLIPQTQHADKSKHRLSLVTPLVTISTYTEVVAATLFFLDISATAVSGNWKGQVSFDLFLFTGFPILMSLSISNLCNSHLSYFTECDTASHLLAIQTADSSVFEDEESFRLDPLSHISSYTHNLKSVHPPHHQLQLSSHTKFGIAIHFLIMPKQSVCNEEVIEVPQFYYWFDRCS